MSKFSDNFWDSNFTSSTGFETVEKRLKDGHRMTKDVIEHLKQRAKIEEEYAKSLYRLAKQSNGSTETGTMKVAWDCFMKETEEISQVHKFLSSNLMQQASNLKQFAEAKKAIRTQHKDLVDKAFKKKVEYLNKTNEQRKAYENKCRELDDIESKIESTKQSAALDKINQLQTKKEKLICDKEKTNDAYKNMVETLEKETRKWEEEMNKYLQMAQQLEVERLTKLRDELWLTTNYISQACVDDDKHCEDIRQALEKCDIDGDINLFIKQKRTGPERPAPIRYIPYKKRELPPRPPPNARFQ